MPAVVRAAGCAAILAGACLLAGCRARPPSKGPAPPPLEVEFVGCLTVTRGPTCHLSPHRELTLWSPGAQRGAAGLRFATDRGALEAQRQGGRHGGWFADLVIPAQARTLEVTGAGGGAWRLALREPPSFAFIDGPLRLHRQGRSDEAAAQLEAPPAGGAARERWIALGQAARVHLSRGRLEPAVALLERSLPGLAGEGEVSLALLDALTLSDVLIERQQRYADGQRVLDRAKALLGEVPALTASVLLLEGRAALHTGDLRSALTSFQAAEGRASRLGMAVDTRRSRRYLVTVLRRLGRGREALALQRGLVADAAPEACERSDDLVTLAITLAELSREPHGGARPPPAPGEDADDLLARGERELAACSDPERSRNIAVERLLVALDRGALADAQARRRELVAMAGAPSPILQVWELEAAGRLALAAQRPRRAEAAYERQAALAARFGLEEEQFRALVGLGQAREAQGLGRRAVAAYRRAEALLEEELGRVPLGEGAFGLARARRRSADQLVAALLRLASPAEALEAARVAEARVIVLASHAHRISRLGGERKRRWQEAAARYQRLRQELEAESGAWQTVPARAEARGADERRRRARETLDEAYGIASSGGAAVRLRLPPAGAGELILAYTRTGEAWVGFAAGAGAASVRAVPLGQLDPAAPADVLARALLQPFAPEIAAAQQIRFLAPPALWRRDLHVLPFAGRPLVARTPVSFGLDIPLPVCPGPGACPPDAAGARAAQDALLVFDPTLDLRGARAEAADVAAALARSGYRVHELGGLAATFDRVAPRLAEVSLLHFAGHTRPGPNEGLDGVLPLAGRTRLLVADVLALARAPDRVVLSSCEAALLPEAEGGLSLAHALVAAGARAVVASTRPLQDRAAGALINELYRQGFAQPAHDPVQALRAAQLARATAATGEDWAAFRILVP